MNRTRRWDMGAIALAVTISIGIAIISCSGGAATSAAIPSNVTNELSAIPADERPLALFIGDSYTKGKGSAEMSYGCRAAVREGWLCALSAIGGTGYIGGGPANRWVDPQFGKSSSFSERATHLSAQYDPALVVLDGGRNDDFASFKYRFDAMISTIAEVRRAWPRATVVVIRPRLLANPGDNAGLDDDFIARLQSDTHAQGVIFIDPLYSLANTDTSGLLAPDGVHPNHAGEQLMTSALVDALDAQHLGFAS